MFYIWVQYDKKGNFEPHMTFIKIEKEEAEFEIQDLKDHGHRAKFGQKFPAVKRFTHEEMGYEDGTVKA